MADSAGFNAVVLPGDLAFSDGGIDASFIIGVPAGILTLKAGAPVKDTDTSLFVWNRTTGRLYVMLSDGSYAIVPAGTGGGGGVTPDQLADEATLRASGDDLQITMVNTGAHYLATIEAQKTSDQPLRMVIGADFQVTVSGRQEAKVYGEVLEFAPRSDSPEAYMVLPLDWRANTQSLRREVSTETEWNAAVASQALQNRFLYLLVTKRLFSTIGTARRAREAGELYRVPPRSTTAEYIVDTTSTDEVNAIVNAAIANGVALWARGPGQNVDDQSRQVYPLAGVFAPGQDNGFALFTDGTGKLSWQRVTATLTQAQQIGLLAIHPRSSTINYTPGKLDTALAGTIRLIVANPELLTGDIWVQGSVDGQPVLAREKWTAATGALDFVITAQLSRLIGQNPALDVEVSFYDAANAGNLVETLRYSIGLQRLPRPLRQAVDANSANTAVDADDGVTVDLAMGFNTTLTITGGEDGLYLTIRAVQDATGSRTLTFGGTNLELSTAAAALDRLLFQRRGAAWEFVGILKAA